MGSELLRRVRWGNVARAAAAVGLVGAVIAWPRLAPPEPRLPASGAVDPGVDGGRREPRTVGPPAPKRTGRERGRRRMAKEERSVGDRGRRRDQGHGGDREGGAPGGGDSGDDGDGAPVGGGDRTDEDPVRSGGANEGGVGGGPGGADDGGGVERGDNEAGGGGDRGTGGRVPAAPAEPDPAEAEFGFEGG